MTLAGLKMDETNSSEKPGETLVEATSRDVDGPKVDESISENLAKSRFDNMSVGQTAWVFRRVAFISLAVYTGYVCEGFELKAGNSIIANAGFIKQFGRENGSGVAALNPTWVSTWSSLLNVGQLVTLVYISWFAENFGRKASFYVAWIWLVVGCIFLNTAKTPAVWALGKLCNGAGVGVLQVICQVYIMEICPNKIRGGMISFQAVWSNSGSIICAVMMEQLNKHHPDNYLLAVRILWAPIGLMILFWVFVPESPWYYARRGDKEKAMKSMRKLYGNVEGYEFEEEYNIIVKTIQHEREMLSSAPNYIHLFQGSNLKRTLTVMLLSVMGQFGGIAIINTYSTYFFSLAGLTDPFLGTVIISCCNLLAIIVWALSTDILGRRSLMNGFETAVVIFLFIVGGLWWTGATTGNKAASNALLVICCLWSFAFTINSMSYYLMAAEVPSALLRVRTGPIAFSIQSVLGIAFSYATPPMLLAMNLKAGFVYGAFSVPTCILMWLYVPETKGRSAAEIDELYERKIPVWRWSETVTSAEEQMRAVFLVKAGVDQGSKKALTQE